MPAIIEQFETAAKIHVISETVTGVSKDPLWVPVNRYPFFLHSEKNEAGLFGHLRGRIVHEVYCRLFLVEEYVAAEVPGQTLLDTRGQ
jgi:hypothetical protein